MCGKVKACCAITNHLQDPICSSRKNATEIAGIAQDINTEVCKKKTICCRYTMIKFRSAFTYKSVLDSKTI
jgi:hypothetical protein